MGIDLLLGETPASGPANGTYTNKNSASGPASGGDAYINKRNVSVLEQERDL